MTADDVHAKLVRALEIAEIPPAKTKSKFGVAVESVEVLNGLVQPLALASIALELREMRQLHQFIPAANGHDNIGLEEQLANTRSREARNAKAVQENVVTIETPDAPS